MNQQKSQNITLIFLWICLPVFNTLNQVAMKMTAGVVANDAWGTEWFIHAAQSPYIWLSFACEIINFAVWLAILKHHHLSKAFPLTAVSYATLMATSWLFFKEPMHVQQVMGVCLIIAGITLLGAKDKKSGA